MTREQVYALIEEHYKENFTRLVSRMSGPSKSKHNAEDIVQEAYLRALQYWKSYKEHIKIGQWFRGILNNSTRDFFRAESLSGMSVDDYGGEIISPSVFHRLELQELIERMGEQPERVETILRLYLLDEYTVKEIEEVVPESKTNIRKIVQRFREEIRMGDK